MSGSVPYSDLETFIPVFAVQSHLIMHDRDFIHAQAQRGADIHVNKYKTKMIGELGGTV